MNKAYNVHQIFSNEWALIEYPWGISSESFTVDTNRKDIPYDLQLRIPVSTSFFTPNNRSAIISAIYTYNDETIEFITASDIGSNTFTTSSIYVIIPSKSLAYSNVYSSLKYSIVANAPTSATAYALYPNNDVNSYFSTATNPSGTNDELGAALKVSTATLTESNAPKIASVLTSLTNDDYNVNSSASTGYQIGTTYTLYPSTNYWDSVDPADIVKPNLSVTFNVHDSTIEISGGKNYKINDTFSVSNGASIKVIDVDNKGAIAEVSLEDIGSDFTSAPTVSYDNSTGSGATVTVNNDYSIASVTLDSTDGFPFVQGDYAEIHPVSGKINNIPYRVGYEIDNPGYYAIANLDKFSWHSVRVSNPGTGYDPQINYNLYVYKPNYTLKQYEYVSNTFLDFNLKLNAPVANIPGYQHAADDSYYNLPKLSIIPDNRQSTYRIDVTKPYNNITHRIS